MQLYRILISITVILVVFWIWNYVTNVYTAVFVSAGLVSVFLHKDALQ